MQNKVENPSVSLQTLVMAIQVLHKEITELKEILKTSTSDEGDYLWLQDLEMAADDLEKSYKGHIEKHQVLNFPSYSSLVKSKIKK